LTCIALDGPLPLFEYAAQVARTALAASPMGMLRPGEKVADLFCGAGGWGEARAMGFPEDFCWPKTQRDTVRLIGNAVSVRTARALIGSVLPGMGSAGGAKR